MLSENYKIVKLLAPAADRFNANPATDVVNLGLADSLTAIVSHSGGTTGKAKIQVEACSAADGTGAEAVAFRYRRMTTGASDAVGAISYATVAADGIETVPTEETLIELCILSEELPAGKPFVRLQLTETANDPVTGEVIGILSGLRYKGPDSPTVLA
jgi:hypothetical protein